MRQMASNASRMIEDVRVKPQTVQGPPSTEGEVCIHLKDSHCRHHRKYSQAELGWHDTATEASPWTGNKTSGMYRHQPESRIAEHPEVVTQQGDFTVIMGNPEDREGSPCAVI